MSTPDYSSPLDIAGPGARHVIGIVPGSASAPLNQSTAELARAMTTLRTRAAEVRTHVSLPSERARRLEDLRAPAADAFRAHARTLAAHAERVEVLSKTASYVKPSSAMPHHTLIEDQALVSKFIGMDKSAQVQLIARCMGDPPQHLRWAEALLRAPRELTDIPPAMHDQLRTAVLQAFDPDQVAAIQVQTEQVELARRAADLASQVLNTELPGLLAELNAEPAPPPEPKTQTVEGVPAHVLDDLRAGPGLSRPSAVEMMKGAK